MTKSKKFGILIISFMLVIAGFLFAACGNSDYSKTIITSSTEHVEMFVGEQKSVTITIQNPVDNMNNTIIYFSTNPDVCSVEKFSTRGYSTNYTITGLKGGNTTISFISIEGSKKKSIDVTVKQYSEKFESAGNSLYVSNSTNFVPSSADYKLDDNATEREVKFYFYGEKTGSNPLTLDSIKSANNEYINGFVKVEISSDNETGNNYLIFTDEEGNTYTWVKNQSLLKAIEAKPDGSYIFTSDDTPILPGQKFAFVAVYQNNAAEEPLFCEREFVVLSDIAVDSISYVYGYKVENKNYVKGSDDTSYKQDKENIILVPNYQSRIDEGIPSLIGEVANYVTVYLEVKIKADENLTKIKSDSNENIINSTYLDYTTDGEGYVTYYFQINCATGKEEETTFDVKFFYDGFENSQDENVSYTLKVPVSVKIIPTTLLVNNADYKQVSVIHEFYNNYGSENAGWQEFFVSMTPNGANFDNIEIDLTGNSDLKLKYKNVTYSGVKVVIDDIKTPVYIKGLTSNTTTDVSYKTFPIRLNFNVIKADMIEVDFKYRILQGAEPLQFKTPSFADDGIYLDLYKDEEITFKNIFTNAAFSSISYSYFGYDKDVVSFTTNGDSPYEQDGDNYYLNFTIKPKTFGNGKYIITIDNGQSISLDVHVVEGLSNVSLTTTDRNNLIIDRKDDGNTTSLYIVNNVNDPTDFYLDMQVIAHNNENSTSINSVILDPDSNIQILSTRGNNKFFNITIGGVGFGEMNIAVKGYSASEEFTLVEKQIDYKLQIIYVEYINTFNIYKFYDCVDYREKNENGEYILDENGDFVTETKATYVNVYTQTTNDNLRSTKLDIRVGNEDAYLFFDPASGKYENAKFSLKYVYWTSGGPSIRQNNADKEYAYANGTSYIIGPRDNPYGVLDLENLTFTTSVNATQNTKFVLYAHVRQYQRTYTFAVNINILPYEEVKNITLQTAVTSSKGITLSALKREYSLIAYVIDPASPTNPTIMASFEGINSVSDDMLTIEMFESAGKYQIKLVLNNNILSNTTNDAIGGTLYIYAQDWLDNTHRLMPSYQEVTLQIPVNYADGSTNRPYILESAEDFVAMKDALSANYEIWDSISVASISSYLPLGGFDGKLIGKSDRAGITGIYVSNGITENNVTNVGLFTTISNTAEISGISFSGSLNVDAQSSAANVGLIAGINNGKLTNIGVTLNTSSVTIGSGNVGGVVGINQGTISQDNVNLNGLLPKTTIFMKDYLSVEGANYVGGIAGLNNVVKNNDNNVIGGIIQKIDERTNGQVRSYTGYLNYMAYSLIKAGMATQNALITVGALVGKSNGIIRGQYWNTNSQQQLPANYAMSGTDVVLYSAGNGIVVGGEIVSYGNISGGIGDMVYGEGGVLTGLTVRTFVRSYKESGAPNSSIIANITGTFSTAPFAIQAVDDGRIGENASMFVRYAKEDDRITGDNINEIAFKIKNASTTIMTESNVKTYISRRYVEPEFVEIEGNNVPTTIVDYTDDSIYYGDVVLVNKNYKQNAIAGSIKFTRDTTGDLSILPNSILKNKMESDGEKLVYYAFYFKAMAEEGIDVVSAQSLFDSEVYSGFNVLSQNDLLYPFVASGEMIFTSRTPSVITIDQSGKITIKRTGLAHISVASILNTTNTMDLYIYVVNYFNPTLNESIIYPNQSAYSLAFDESEIKLRGNNSASVFVVPNYNFVSNEKTIINKYGKVVLGGYVFNLEQSYDLKADININSAVIQTTFDNSKNYLNFENIGTETVITKGSEIEEGIYTLEIKPILTMNLDNKLYSSVVNKTLNNVNLDYKHGAIVIDNKYYEEAVLFSNKTLFDEIIITTTDINEKIPKFKITSIDGTDARSLFTVDFVKDETNSSSEVDGQGVATVIYKLTLNINKNSDLYKNRYTQNIYGDYAFVIISNSNEDVTKNIMIHFEQTNVNNIVVDNYTSLQDINSYGFMTSSSDYAYPGVTGLLEITLNPDDSDYDYILIENDDENYESGHASANFGLVAKLSDATNGLFTDQTIAGSVTSKGIKIKFKDIVDLYGNYNYTHYNGIVYVQYDFGSANVLEGSKSKICISVVKDDNTATAAKELTIKLQNYVNVTIEGKVGSKGESDAYISYEVARGLSYKLKINSYGFQKENIRLISRNESLGTIEKIGDTYYLNITKGNIDYTNNSNIFNISAVAEQTDGEETRLASSNTTISVYEYVVNYNGETQNNADIVDEMDGGVINLQVGSQITFGIDMIDYIEFDDGNNEVILKIKEFFNTMANHGSWTIYTNLISNDESNYSSAPEPDSGSYDGDNPELKKFTLLDESGNSQIAATFYFRYNGLNFIPVRTNDPADNFYYFIYQGRFKVQNGVYVFDSSSAIDNKKTFLNTRFKVNVFSSSSEESPIPIYDYEDFVSMQNGGYYILLNDLVMPRTDTATWSAFTPLAGNFASFDGNGHSIYFEGNYDMGALSNIGLFSSLKTGSVIKNLNVYYKAAESSTDGMIQFTTTADTFNFAGLVVDNAGIITNCHIYTNKNQYITVRDPNSPLNAACYLAGIVTNNSGFITNSSVSANIRSDFYIAGFVAQNSGKIAASSYTNGYIYNQSSFDHNVAGFVIKNLENGQIITSYVSGAISTDSVISKDTTSYIESTLPTAGFVYDNGGTIKDCYTNIDLSSTHSDAAGFVYKNGGEVRNCFSLSKLNNNNTASAGFASSNINDEGTGKFENCYYYYSDQGAEPINTAITQVDFGGISRLNDDGFANLSENFVGYSYSNTISTDAVWFYSGTNSLSPDGMFVKYVPTDEKNEFIGEDNQVQVNTIYNSEQMVFAKGRLELVAPNVSALSIRNFNYSELDTETGNITYYYLDESSAPNRGSLHNPLLISTAENFENNIIQYSSTGRINKKTYRIVSDIDYSSYDEISQTYKITFAGMMEGNGMNISQISMASMERQSNGGLFGQIGCSTTEQGIVKNLYLNPRQVSFSNTTNVGTLAGTLRYGYIYDIKAETTSENVTVTGANFVGGIIGKAVTAYKIQDASTNLNVTSVFLPSSISNYVENVSAETAFSYAGGIVGFAGKGNIYNVQVENVTSVMGGHAGLVFGGIGRNCNVMYVNVKIPGTLQIKAYNFGGLVSGEISGNIDSVYVDGNGQQSNIFAVIPRVAKSVGGITGILSGGSISNAYMNQSFILENTAQDSYIALAGGIAGLVYTSQNYKSNIYQCVVNADITARSILGGAVGAANSYLSIDSVAVIGDTLTVEGKKIDPYLGGVIAGVAISSVSEISIGNAELIMTNTYCWSNLIINTNSPGTKSQAKVGGLIGLVNERKRVTLSYCYTTSSISATVYDSRALGAPQETEIAPANYIVGDTDNKTVYYYGATKLTDSDPAAETIKHFVTFKTKVKVGTTEAAECSVLVNNYGISSHSLITAQEDPFEKARLNNLYANSFKAIIGSQVKTFVYDIANDKYNIEGENGTFVKDPNDSNIYRRNVLYSDGYFTENITGMTYLYEGQENGRYATFVYFEKIEKKNNENVLERCIRSSSGLEYVLNSKDDVLGGSGSIVNYKVGDATQKAKVYIENGAWIAKVLDNQENPTDEIVIKISTRYEQISKSSLLQEVRYKDSDGNIYDQSIDASQHHVLKNETLGTIESFTNAELLAEKIQELGLKEIWQLNPMGLTTLAFEKDLLSWVTKV